MQRIAVLLFSLFFVSATFGAESVVVKVRIQSMRSLKISGSNIRFVGIDSKVRPVAVTRSHEVLVKRVRIAGQSYWQISQAKGLSKNILSSQEVLLVQGDHLRHEATQFPNKLIIREGARQNLDVIGVVPLEEYVLAVLVNEMPLSWPMETLKAQAVAIRSYTLAVLQERHLKFFHVESSVLDQVYKKVHNLKPELLRKAQTAVEETRGINLLNLKSRPLKAFYHSDCGGNTVSASSVWGNETDSDVGTASDDFCAGNPRSRWSLTLTQQKFAGLLKSFTGEIRSNEFRKLVGFMDLKSTRFEIQEDLNLAKVTLVGRGFGHGVGMCQWGSKSLGLRGFTYQGILKHYYPMASLTGTTRVTRVASQVQIEN